MLNVSFTIDVEIWCDGWRDIDRKFADAFRRYIHGPGNEYGLPFQLRLLNEHGMTSVCFVEPLFAGRFGFEPLEEIVGLVNEAGHEIQLHLHTEWIDEARKPILGDRKGKRQFLRQFNLAEQSRLISTGIEWLCHAGAPRPTAFRAGSFGLNRETLSALAENGIYVDCSYNATMTGPSSGVCVGETLNQPRLIGSVLEVPMTVYSDGRRLRHVQLTACTFSEMEHLLWQALDANYETFVILSHSAELLTSTGSAGDGTVISRLRRLCSFLERNSDVFQVRGFRDGEIPAGRAASVPMLKSPLWRTALRAVEQGLRSRHRWA